MKCLFCDGTGVGLGAGPDRGNPLCGTCQGTGSVPEPRSKPEPGPTWAIVELLGHVRLGGKLTEEEKFGTKLGRLDIPHGDGFVTRLFGGGSVYSITYVDEAAARAVATKTPEPVSQWELPKQIAAPASRPKRYSDIDDPDEPHDEGDDERPF